MTHRPPARPGWRQRWLARLSLAAAAAAVVLLLLFGGLKTSPPCCSGPRAWP